MTWRALKSKHGKEKEAAFKAASWEVALLAIGEQQGRGIGSRSKVLEHDLEAATDGVNL